MHSNCICLIYKNKQPNNDLLFPPQYLYASPASINSLNSSLAYLNPQYPHVAAFG